MNLAHDTTFEAESAETYQANRLTLRMSGASEAARPANSEINPEYIREAALETLDSDALKLAAYAEGRLGVDGSTITHGIGRWKDAAEIARVIEIVTYGPILRADLVDIRDQALRLGYTIFATIDATTAAELY